MGRDARRDQFSPREALQRLNKDRKFMWWMKRPRLYLLYLRLTRASAEQRDATILALAFDKTELCRRCGWRWTHHAPGRHSQTCDFM